MCRKLCRFLKCKVGNITKWLSSPSCAKVCQIKNIISTHVMATNSLEMQVVVTGRCHVQHFFKEEHDSSEMNEWEMNQWLCEWLSCSTTMIPAGGANTQAQSPRKSSSQSSASGSWCVPASWGHCSAPQSLLNLFKQVFVVGCSGLVQPPSLVL